MRKRVVRYSATSAKPVVVVKVRSEEAVVAAVSAAMAELLDMVNCVFCAWRGILGIVLGVAHFFASVLFQTQNWCWFE